MLPSEEQCRAVHELWDELADFPASSIDAALRHLMDRLGGWLKAGNLCWIGTARIGQGATATRDALCGWRALKLVHWRVTPEILEQGRKAAETQDDADPGMTTVALARQMGTWRVHRLRDGWIDFHAFERTAHYAALYKERQISDRLYAGIPVNADSEAFLLADRFGEAAPFSRNDAALMEYTLRGLKWLHRELLLFHGILIAEKPLSPTERRIVRLLLTECSEREIAETLKQSPATTHKYITGIFRKYNVSGRMGLMARWLNRRG